MTLLMLGLNLPGRALKAIVRILQDLWSPEHYVSSIQPENAPLLMELEAKLRGYYRNRQYHDVWIKGVNADWHPERCGAQVRMCQWIHRGDALLEIGCGDGSAADEIRRYVPDIHYVGLDLNPALWAGRCQFVAASACALPLDRVLSMSSSRCSSSSMYPSQLSSSQKAGGYSSLGAGF